MRKGRASKTGGKEKINTSGFCIYNMYVCVCAEKLLQFLLLWHSRLFSRFQPHRTRTHFYFLLHCALLSASHPNVSYVYFSHNRYICMGGGGYAWLLAIFQIFTRPKFVVLTAKISTISQFIYFEPFQAKIALHRSKPFSSIHLRECLQRQLTCPPKKGCMQLNTLVHTLGYFIIV